MRNHKHIEELIAAYIASRYRRVAEIGIGNNFTTASRLHAAGLLAFATDLNPSKSHLSIPVIREDIFSPSDGRYENIDLIYAIRPGIEMIPPMLNLATRVNSDLIIYHLGNEIYENGGECIDCGVILHRYHTKL